MADAFWWVLLVAGVAGAFWWRDTGRIVPVALSLVVMTVALVVLSGELSRG